MGICLKSQHIINFYIPACPHPTNINDIDNTKLSVFPNPADEYIELKFNDNFNEISNVKILDVTGKFICDIDIRSYNQEYTIKQDIKQLIEGVYYISVQTDSKTELYRFIKLQLP